MNREELLEEFRVTMKIIQRCMEQEHYATVELICRDVLRTLAKEEEKPKREWAGLTDAQVEEIAEYHGIDGLYETSRIDFYRAIEITLKEKNT